MSDLCPRCHELAVPDDFARVTVLTRALDDSDEQPWHIACLPWHVRYQITWWRRARAAKWN